MLTVAHRAATSQEKVQRVADRYRVPYADMIGDAASVARGQIDIMALETLLHLGDQEQVLAYLDKAVLLTETPFRVAAASKASKLTLDIMKASGNATRCDFGGPQITDEHRESLLEYTAGTEINMVLRGGGNLGSLEKIKTDLDTMMAASPLTEAKIAYRMIGDGVLDDVKVGAMLHDAGFVSTSTSYRALDSMVSDLGYDSGDFAILQLDVPKGTRALNVAEVLKGQHEYQFGYQKELLLDRGYSFKITSEYTDDKGRRILKATVVK